jgi:uncharacterized membrane protein
MGIAIFALLTRFIPTKTPVRVAAGIASFALLYTLFITLSDVRNVSGQPIMNTLWVYLALPALITLGAAKFLNRTQNIREAEALNGLGLIFVILFLVYQIRHFITDGTLYSRSITFDELGLYVATGLAFTLGRTWMVDSTSKHNVTVISAKGLVSYILMALTWVTLAIFALGLCLVLAPLFNYDATINGSTLFNSLIIAYLVPGILMGLIFWRRSQKPIDSQTKLIGGFGLVGAMMYITSQIRVYFSGMQISIFEKFPEGLETYAITASWMLIGIGALIIGIRTRRKSLRILSGFILTLTVFKAFLVDMGTLEGVLRAMSFVVLGIVLIIIGQVYQKLVFNDDTLSSQER